MPASAGDGDPNAGPKPSQIRASLMMMERFSMASRLKDRGGLMKICDLRLVTASCVARCDASCSHRGVDVLPAFEKWSTSKPRGDQTPSNLPVRVKGRSTGAVQVHRCGLGPPVRWSERQVLGSTQQAKQATELGSLGTHQVSTRPKGS